MVKRYYEDVLEQVGEFGTWQLRILIMLWIPMFFCGTQFITTDFMSMEPKKLFCEYKDCNANLSNVFLSGRDIHDNLDRLSQIFPLVEKYYGSNKSRLSARMTIAELFCTINIPKISEGKCIWDEGTKNSQSYDCFDDDLKVIYDPKFELDSTVITYYNLGCDHYRHRFAFHTISAVGSASGSLIMAWMANKFGRRPALLQSMVTMSLGAILEAHMPTFASMCLMTFLNSFGKWAIFQICFLYLFEIIGYEKRFTRIYWISYKSLACVTFFIPYSLGKIAATAFVQKYNYWKQFEFVIGLCSCSQVLLIFLIPESPYWLLNCHKVKQAKQLLEKIAKTNGKNGLDIKIEESRRDRQIVVDGEELESYLEITFGESRGVVVMNQKSYSISKIFAPETIQYTVAFLWSWPMISFLRFGLVKAGQVVPQDLFTTSYYRSLLEILGLVITALTEGLMGRRFNLLFLLTMTCFIFCLLSIQQLKVHAHLVFIANLPSISAYALIVLFTLSVYPTSLRSTTLGIFTACSSIGEIMAPIFIDYVPYKYKNHEIAFFAMGFAALLSACLCYYLPETLGRPFPETMNDVLYLRNRAPPNCSLIKYEDRDKERRVEYVTKVPLLDIPNFDTAPTEEIRKWREERFGVNYLNQGFNTREVARQLAARRRDPTYNF